MGGYVWNGQVTAYAITAGNLGDERRGGLALC